MGETAGFDTSAFALYPVDAVRSSLEGRPVKAKVAGSIPASGVSAPNPQALTSNGRVVGGSRDSWQAQIRSLGIKVWQAEVCTSLEDSFPNVVYDADDEPGYAAGIGFSYRNGADPTSGPELQEVKSLA